MSASKTLRAAIVGGTGYGGPGGALFLPCRVTVHDSHVLHVLARIRGPL